MSKRAAVYARYSSHSQTDQSIEGQLAAARAYAKGRGYRIVAEYCDRAKTGTNSDRAEFQRMLRDSDKHAWDVLITWKIDRIGRNREELAFNKYRLRRNGVRIEYVAESVPDSPEGVILESVLEGMAEYYSLQLAQNIRRGMLESAKKGKKLGTTPLGYRKSADGGYEIDETRAPVVRAIFEAYADGDTASEIVDQLNNAGIRTSRGNTFSRSSLQHVLHNVKYTGLYIGGKGTVRLENAVPVIIDQELFDRVQEMSRRNQRAPAAKWSSTEYILTGKLFCGKCGSQMLGESGYGKQGRKYEYYKCFERKKTGGCDMRILRKEVIEDLVLEYTIRMLRSDEIIDAITDAVWDYYETSDETSAKRAAIEAEMAGTKKAIANLVTAVEKGMPYDAVSGRMDELQASYEALESARAELDLQETFRLEKDQIRFFLEQFRTADLKSARSRRRLIDAFINAVYVFDDHLKVAYNFGDRSDQISLEAVLGSDTDRTSPLDRKRPNIAVSDHTFILRIGLP